MICILHSQKNGFVETVELKGMKMENSFQEMLRVEVKYLL